MDMLKNFVFAAMEKEITKFLEQNGALPIFNGYSDCWMGRGSHCMKPPRIPDLTPLKV